MNDLPEDHDHDVLPADHSAAVTTFDDEQALAAFEVWLDAELALLVSRWLPFAAPNAARGANRSRR